MALSNGKPKKTVFLDKDGTLVYNVPYNVDPRFIILREHTASGLRLLMEEGYQLVIITNQSGVAHGKFSEKHLLQAEEKLREMLLEDGVKLSGFYYCPHHPNGVLEHYALHCSCRKPKPGMLKKAARELRADLNFSWMVGDILNDVEAGVRAGCRTVLISNGENESEWNFSGLRTPTVIASDMEQAARYIIGTDRRIAVGRPNGHLHGTGTVTDNQ